MRVATLALVVVAACAGARPEPEEPEEAEPPRVAVALRFTDAPDDADGSPRTGVMLVRIVEDGPQETVDLGAYRGACSHAAADPFLIRASCWWAGSTAVLTVAREHDELIVRRSVEGEELEEVTRLALPEDARLEVIGPETFPVD
jgi:hypothetical protein